MAASRETSRLVRVVGSQSTLRFPSTCARRFASSAAATEQPITTSKQANVQDLESESSFSTPAPDAKTIEGFKVGSAQSARERRLPGNRYQYHPPKYYRGPLHPIQMPRSSDPVARDFTPGPFSVPRLKHTYDSMIAPDLMTLAYTHTPPGTGGSESKKGELRSWDGSSPYHKNRPRRGPRGGQSSRLGLLEREISWNNIPELEEVTINVYSPLGAQDKEYLHVTRAVLQAISGQFPEVTKVKHQVSQWKVRKGDKTGAKVTLKGASAYEFVDKLVTLVLPKIKDWPGINATTGDDNGNLAFGMQPAWMAYFPEIEFNYDMYPSKHVPGCDIFIKTSGTSDRQGRLLMEALGFPFYGKAMH